MEEPNLSHEISGSLFTFISSVFKKHGVRAVLVGGYALIANKVQRMTFDIDFMITADDCAAIEPELLQAGYSLFNRQDAFVQFKAEKQALRDLDFLIGDRHTLDILIAEGKKVSIAGESFSVPSPLHLIAMKLHSMSGNRKRELKDFPDVVQLLTANAINPLDERVKKLFETYKVGDLYNRVITLTGAHNGR
jgi:hypothetical protein